MNQNNQQTSREVCEVCGTPAGAGTYCKWAGCRGGDQPVPAHPVDQDLIGPVAWRHQLPPWLTILDGRNSQVIESLQEALAALDQRGGSLEPLFRLKVGAAAAPDSLSQLANRWAMELPLIEKYQVRDEIKRYIDEEIFRASAAATPEARLARGFQMLAQADAGATLIAGGYDAYFESCRASGVLPCSRESFEADQVRASIGAVQAGRERAGQTGPESAARRMDAGFQMPALAGANSVETLDEQAENALLWCYRRMKNSYGRLPFIEEAVAGLQERRKVGLACALTKAGKDAREIAEIWDSAKADAAMYVEAHCVDGEVHAKNIMTQRRPKITPALPKTGITPADITQVQRDLARLAAGGDVDVTSTSMRAQAVIEGLLSGLDAEQLS